jgi:hypothetical protein
VKRLEYLETTVTNPNSPKLGHGNYCGKGAESES